MGQTARIMNSVDSDDKDYVTYCVDDDDRTPLHKSILPAMAQTLLDGLTPQTREKYIELSDNSRQFILHLSAQCDRVEVAELIIRSVDEDERETLSSTVSMMKA